MVVCGGYCMKMRARWLSFLLSLFVSFGTHAQVETTQSPLPDEILPYSVDAVVFASTRSTQSRLDVFIRVSYENLSFVQRDNAYHASYEVTIDLVDSMGRLYGEKIWTEEVRTATFEESVSSQGYSLTERVFEVPPGRYSLVTVVRDNETRGSRRMTREVVVPDFSAAGLSLSDVMIVSRMTLDEKKKVIVPNVSTNVGGLPDGFYAFFEAYNRDSLEAVNVTIRVLNERDESVLTAKTLSSLVPGRNQLFEKIQSSNFTLGDYTLQIDAYSGEDDSLRRPLASTQRKFIVRWRGMPMAVKDVDIAIEQIQYIANPGEIDIINEAETSEEKRRRFLEFWKKRDPNPNTARNEAMEEYYSKVEYANKHFRHYIEGWRTDMGMVYIIFGAPNNVDRHPFDIDSKPYEVWSYYDLNHQFVFVDETGFGDYRLLTPIWEVWQRPR